MFVGEYQITFLGKGRIALPKKIRTLLSGEKVVLTRGFEKCIFGYDKKVWQTASQRQTEIPITEEKGRAIRRYLFSGAMVVRFDSQGRVVIPPFLLEYAQIGEKITLIGTGDHFEIWDTATWKKELILIEKEKL